MQATEQLKPQHRVVFVLAEFEGKGYDAIAEITGAALGTVKSRLNRARKHFRDALLGQGLAAADLDQLEVPDVEAPSDEPVDLNTADLEELCTLPNVGPTVALKIIEARPIETVEKLAEIEWFSDGRVEKIRPLVRLSGAELAQFEETVDMEPAMPGITVQWRIGHNGPSAVHVVRSGTKTDGFVLACGGELPV